MKHARPDYARIQDPWNKIPEDEPVLLIRAQDILGWRVARTYAALTAEMEGHDPLLLEQIRLHAHRMRNWTPKKKADLPKEDCGCENTQNLGPTSSTHKGT